MTTIHYALNNPDREMDPGTEPDRAECIQTLRRAIDIARFICALVDEDISEDPIVTADRFLIDLHLEGRCTGSEPISYGWTAAPCYPEHDASSTAGSPLQPASQLAKSPGRH